MNDYPKRAQVRRELSKLTDQASAADLVCWVNSAQRHGIDAREIMGHLREALIPQSRWPQLSRPEVTWDAGDGGPGQDYNSAYQDLCDPW